MPILGFLKTASMPNTYAEITYVNCHVQNKYVVFNVAIWTDDTKSTFLTNITYEVKSEDPVWDWDKFADIINTAEDYLLGTREEFEESSKAT